MKQYEIYELCIQHKGVCAAWHDKVITIVLTELNKNGYVEPRCYVIYYNFLISDYQTQIIEMTKEQMLDPVRNEANYNILQNIDASLPFPCLAMMFVSEGTTPVKDRKDKMPFLLITFETRLEGRKHLYRMEKESLVMPGGTTRIKVTDIKYDHAASAAHESAAIEKFAHILRPNLYNPSTVIYN